MFENTIFRLGILWGFLPLLWTFDLFGGTFTAQLDRIEVQVQDQLILTITIEGEVDGEFALPPVENLEYRVLNTEQRTHMMNGQITRSRVYIVGVGPLKAGTFTIPSMTMSVDGQKISTLPLQFRAVEGSVGGGGANSNEPPSQADEVVGGGGEAAADAQKRAFNQVEKTGGVFSTRKCEPKEVFVGEQILCTVRIYHPGNLKSGQRIPESSADFRRFAPDGEKKGQEIINGKRFAVHELTEIFVPLKEGEFKVPPFMLEANVVTWEQRKNPLDQFFDRFGGGVFDFDFSFADVKNVRIGHQPNVVVVKPVPTEGQPPNFKRIVGDFEFSASISSKEITLGDSVNLTLSLSGYGVLDTAKDPELKLDPSIKVYGDKPEYNERVEDLRGIQSQKTFKMALVPSKPGPFNIGVIQIPIFDPRKAQYRVLSQDLGQILVHPAQVEEKLYTSGPTDDPVKQQVKKVGEDLFGSHGPDELKSFDGLSAFEQKFLFGSLSFAYLAPLLSLFWTKKLQSRKSDQLKHRKSKALKSFKIKLAALNHRSQESSVATEGATLLYRGFREFIGDLENLQGNSLSLREIEDILKRRNVDSEVKDKVVKILENLERIEFRGVTFDSQGLTAWAKELETFAQEIDQRGR